MLSKNQLAKIPFNQAYVTGKELKYLKQAIDRGNLAGNGEFSQKCQAWLESHIGCRKALLTHSCTAALEMAAILADIQPGDEIIMPSYTFVSTANAFVLRGGVPVFVDICPDTLNIDPAKIEAAISGKTKAIVPIHYAGISADMDAIMEIADRYNLLAIEDSAQGIISTYKARPLGSLGHLAAISFHETKNISAGESGALLINTPHLIERAEIIWEKGTNRRKFFRKEVDKYTWIDIGSSYLPNELTAAFLWAQLQAAETILALRLKIWEQYHQAFEELELQGKIRRPIIPQECQHNAHIYYLLVPNLSIRNALIENLKIHGIKSVFHYVPLHSSPAGRKYGYSVGNLAITDNISNRLLRLPLFPNLTELQVEFIVSIVKQFFV